MEEPKGDTDEGDGGDDPSRCEDEDPYGSDAEEQNPFGHEDSPVIPFDSNSIAACGQIGEAVSESGVVGVCAGSGASSSDAPVICPLEETLSERLTREFVARKARKVISSQNRDEGC
jgi:hypothetical protein